MEAVIAGREERLRHRLGGAHHGEKHRAQHFEGASKSRSSLARGGEAWILDGPNGGFLLVRFSSFDHIMARGAGGDGGGRRRQPGGHLAGRDGGFFVRVGPVRVFPGL